MPILHLLIWVALLGLAAWFIVTIVPMPAPFPNLVIGVAVLIAVLLILSAFGLLEDLGRVPRLR